MYVVANLISTYRRGAPRVSKGHFAPRRTLNCPVCGGCGGKFRGKSIGASCGDFDRNRVAEEPMWRLEFGVEAGR